MASGGGSAPLTHPRRVGDRASPRRGRRAATAASPAGWRISNGSGVFCVGFYSSGDKGFPGLARTQSRGCTVGPAEKRALAFAFARNNTLTHENSLKKHTKWVHLVFGWSRSQLILADSIV